MLQTTATTQIPQHVTALLSHLTSRPSVQSTFILSRKDGSIIQSTGLLAAGPTRNGNASTTQTSAVTEETSSTDTDPTTAVPAEPSPPSSPTSTASPNPTPQKPYQPSQAEALAARVFAFVTSASELGLSLSHPVENSFSTGLNGPEGLGNGTSREEGEADGGDREDEDEIKLLRLRTKKHEIVVVPDKKYLLCVVHDAAHPGGTGAGIRSSR